MLIKVLSPNNFFPLTDFNNRCLNFRLFIAVIPLVKEYLKSHNALLAVFNLSTGSTISIWFLFGNSFVQTNKKPILDSKFSSADYSRPKGTNNFV